MTDTNSTPDTTDTMRALMLAHLLEVFGERDRDRRKAAIERTYAQDIVFADPDGTLTGQEAIDEKVQGLLDSAPGFVFSPAGSVLVSQDLAYLAWNLGPEGQSPVVSGMDICFIADGRITRAYTLLNGS